MSDRDEVMFANDAFYMCFAAGDADGMDDLWAESASVSCIVPKLHEVIPAAVFTRDGNLWSAGRRLSTAGVILSPQARRKFDAVSR